MSKQSECKDKQEFQHKPVWPICGNCKSFKLDSIKEKGWGDSVWVREKNLRCGIGNFKVGKSDTCKKHAPKA
jgi:hypothetical protein